MRLGTVAVAVLSLAAVSPADAAMAPARYAVRGKPLARPLGKAVSVFPARGLVTVEGCRTRSSRVRRRRVTATVVCGKVTRRLTATLGAGKVRGVVRAGRHRRRFTARRVRLGVTLHGRGRALARLRSTDHAARHELDVSRARDGTLVARTEIVVTLRPGAGVSQLDAALAGVGGGIVSSVAGDDRVLVGLPDPGSLAALDKVIRALRHRPGVRSVRRSEMPAGNELPPRTSAPPTASQAAELSHLLAARIPAAWNARAAVKTADRPTVVVLDSFGNGPLSRHVDASYDHASLPRSSVHVDHGYEVVSVLAGDFASDGTAAGRVAGVFPATTRLKVLDERGFTFGEEEDDLLRAADATAGRIVANTSFGWTGTKDDADAIVEGADWARRERGQGLEARMFHATSAGNRRDGRAQTNSSFAAAATRTDLTFGGAPLSPLSNTLAVESVADTGAQAFAPGCLDQPASHGGSVAAVGHHVFALDGRGRAVNVNGSSFASPQVAGLAEYLWSIAPDLTPAQVAGAIRAAGRAPAIGCLAPAPAPELDAYAAVLSLDHPVRPGPASAPVRLAILDVDGNGHFDGADLRALAPAAFATTGRRDWSRDDLNGDGLTGGPSRAAFDLDPTGSTRAGAATLSGVSESVGGVPHNFDESGATDADVLCYYAYSGLYTGTTQDRTGAVGAAGRCNEPTVTPGIQLDSRSARLDLEAHATAGATTIPSDPKSFVAPAGLDPLTLIRPSTVADADANDLDAGELHTHAVGQIAASVQPTSTGGWKLDVTQSGTATRTASGAGPAVGSATVSDAVTMRVTVPSTAHVHLTSTVTGAASLEIQVGSDPPSTQPNGTLDAPLDPGSYEFLVQCQAVATISAPSRTCAEDVHVAVEPGA